MNEAIILGSALWNQECLYIILGSLKADNFSQEYRPIFEVIERLHAQEKSVTLARVHGYLREHQVKHDPEVWMRVSTAGQYDVDVIEDAIEDLIADKKVAVLKGLGSYLLNTQAKSGDMMSQINDTLALCASGPKKTTRLVSEILKDFKDGMSYLEYVRKKQETAHQGQNDIEGIPTYYPLLDSLIGGYLNGSVTILAADTNSGKTTFAAAQLLKILMNRPKTKVAFFSYEMTFQQMAAKLIAQKASIKESAVLEGVVLDCGFQRPIYEEEFLRIQESANWLAKHEIFVDHDYSPSISQVAARAKSVVSRGVELIIIDYLTLMKPNRFNNSNHLNINEISKTLQALSRELKIPLIVLCQINREGRSAESAPKLHHIRESGSIEEDADTVIMLNRPEKYDANRKPGILEAYVRKNRLWNGTLGQVDFCKVGERLEEMKPIKEVTVKAFKCFTPD